MRAAVVKYPRVRQTTDAFAFNIPPDNLDHIFTRGKGDMSDDPTVHAHPPTMSEVKHVKRRRHPTLTESTKQPSPMAQCFVAPSVLFTPTPATARVRAACSMRAPASRSSRSAKLNECAQRIAQWQELTGAPAGRMPTTTQVRCCSVAQSLRLSNIIYASGGFREVRDALGLVPEPLAKQNRRERVTELARRLEALCMKEGRPPPSLLFPSRKFITEHDPYLSNCIAALPSKAGYATLKRHFQPDSELGSIANSRKDKKTELEKEDEREKEKEYGKWVNADFILEQLRPFQAHPNVMPSLGDLPADMTSAIQRKGGAALFAKQRRLVHFRDHFNSSRIARVAAWLARQARYEAAFPSLGDAAGYRAFVKAQAADPPSFPKRGDTPGDVHRAITQIGSKKSIGLRFGYFHNDALNMGPFSIQLAADVLEFALEHLVASHDGSVAMPTVPQLTDNGAKHLADAVLEFGGEVEVGRRLGLVPQVIVSEDATLISDDLQTNGI